MTDSATTTPSAYSYESEAAASRSPRLPQRRRPALIVMGLVVLLATVGANVALIASLDRRVDVLVLTRDVSWGHPVTPEDLRAVPMPPDALAYAIPAREASGIVGETAAVNLVAGSVVSRRQLTVQAIPGPGQRLVGLHLASGRYPARALHAGEAIQVIPLAGGGTSGQSGVDTATPAQTRPGFAARIVEASPPDPNGAITADVLVDAASAEQASTAAAGDAVVLVLGPS